MQWQGSSTQNHLKSGLGGGSGASPAADEWRPLSQVKEEAGRWTCRAGSTLPFLSVPGLTGRRAQPPDSSAYLKVKVDSCFLYHTKYNPSVLTKWHLTLAFICMFTPLVSYFTTLDLLHFEFSPLSKPTVSLLMHSLFFLLKELKSFWVAACAWMVLSHRGRHFWWKQNSNCEFFLSQLWSSSILNVLSWNANLARNTGQDSSAGCRLDSLTFHVFFNHTAPVAVTDQTSFN